MELPLDTIAFSSYLVFMREAKDAFGLPIRIGDLVIYRQDGHQFIVAEVTGFGAGMFNPLLQKIRVKPIQTSGAAYTLPKEEVKVYAANCLLKTSV